MTDRARLDAIKQALSATKETEYFMGDIAWLVERLEEALEVLKAEAQVVYSGAFHSDRTGDFLSRFEEERHEPGK